MGMIGSKIKANASNKVHDEDGLERVESIEYIWVKTDKKKRKNNEDHPPAKMSFKDRVKLIIARKRNVRKDVHRGSDFNLVQGAAFEKEVEKRAGNGRVSLVKKLMKDDTVRIKLSQQELELCLKLFNASCQAEGVQKMKLATYCELLCGAKPDEGNTSEDESYSHNLTTVKNIYFHFDKNNEGLDMRDFVESVSYTRRLATSDAADRLLLFFTLYNTGTGITSGLDFRSFSEMMQHFVSMKEDGDAAQQAKEAAAFASKVFCGTGAAALGRINYHSLEVWIGHHPAEAEKFIEGVGDIATVLKKNFAAALHDTRSPTSTSSSSTTVASPKGSTRFNKQ